MTKASHLPRGCNEFGVRVEFRGMQSSMSCPKASSVLPASMPQPSRVSWVGKGRLSPSLQAETEDDHG